MNATAETQWRSPPYIHRHAVPRGRSRVSALVVEFQRHLRILPTSLHGSGEPQA